MRRRDGLPILVSCNGERSRPLQRVDLRQKSSFDQYDEAWLQGLLHEHPGVFPAGQIEPGFGELIAVCRELPLRSGYLDNFFMTREGRLVLIETKLWRNPEARRTAIAQLMDYASAMFSMSYGELESAVRKARKARGLPSGSLFEIVNGREADESDFHDAVAWNLRQGRALLAVVGDGIHEDIMPLSQLLQSHAGHRFTFSLVELAIYEDSLTRDRTIVPSVLAQTALIERGVIRVERGNLSVESAKADLPSATAARPMSISEDEFYETLAAKCPSQPALLRTFLAEAEALGLYTEFQGGVNLKHASPEGLPLNVAAITKAGVVDTGPASWGERARAGEDYSKAVADLIGGTVKYVPSGSSWAKTSLGKMPKLPDLLPQHKDGWLQAIDRYIRTVLGEFVNDSRQQEMAHDRAWVGSPKDIVRLQPAVPDTDIRRSQG